MPLIDAVPPVRGRVGRPRRRSDRLFADRAHDHDRRRRQLRTRNIKPVIARRRAGHGLALLHWFRRLRIRWEVSDDIHTSGVLRTSQPRVLT
ncbi:hypothetical protein [Saccharothrix sp. 6-C]|uniref:hypothetical protein n=1 Tax=Saccharothrix sp. 6-C TaxID=2781735 RepID=UPI003FA76094